MAIEFSQSTFLADRNDCGRYAAVRPLASSMRWVEGQPYKECLGLFKTVNMILDPCASS